MKPGLPAPWQHMLRSSRKYHLSAPVCHRLYITARMARFSNSASYLSTSTMNVNTLHEGNVPDVLKHELAPDVMKHIRRLLNGLYHAKQYNGLNHAREELDKMAVRLQKWRN